MTIVGRTLTAYNAQGAFSNRALWQNADGSEAVYAPGLHDIALAVGTFSLTGSVSVLGLGFYSRGGSTIGSATAVADIGVFSGDIIVQSSTLSFTESADGATGIPLYVSDPAGSSGTALTLINTTLSATSLPGQTAALIGVGGADAVVSVSVGSTLSTNGAVVLGADDPAGAFPVGGTGTLNVVGGGAVTIAASGAGALVIGQDYPGSSAVWVDGAGSTLHVAGGGITVGNHAAGVLGVADGAAVSADGTILVGTAQGVASTVTGAISVLSGGRLNTAG